MQKHLFIILFSFLGLGLMAQHDHGEELTCSKARFAQEYYKNSKDIEQSPHLWDYDVKHYFIDIEIHANTVHVGGDVTFKAQVVAEELETFAFELIDDMTITEVYINDISHSFTHTNNTGLVTLQTPIAQGELFTAKISYAGTPPTGGFFSGISQATDWGKQVVWTLSEPFAARDWWPTKQVLEDKADSTWIFLTTEEENMAGSNGLLTNVTTMPDNKLRYEWKSNYAIAYYLISFAVSEYQEYNIYAHPEAMNGDSILIQNFIYDASNCLETYKDDIDQTSEMVELFSDLYVLYPFHEEKYGHCLTDLGGGMEHQTMSTMGGFNFGLVAHELGHMWFGDNVTCATWSDIWVNEGFATYTDYLAHEFILGQSAANSEMNGIHTSVMSEPGGSVYIPEDEITYDNVWRIFNGRLSYNKGAAIIHMIRFELQDDDLFFQVLHDYQEQYGDSTATGLDFMGVLNETSGMDFTDFFDQWYFGEGYPTYSIEWSQDDANAYFQITQTTSKPSVTPLFKMLMGYKLKFYDQTDTIIYRYQDDNVISFSVPLTKDIGLINIDPGNWVLNKQGSIVVDIDETNDRLPFSMGPNPANDILSFNFFDNNQETYSLSIFNLSGAEVLNQTIDASVNQVKIAVLPAGSYIVKVTNGKNIYNKKLIIRN